jgi:C-terminal peptidase prc
MLNLPRAVFVSLLLPSVLGGSLLALRSPSPVAAAPAAAPTGVSVAGPAKASQDEQTAAVRELVATQIEGVQGAARPELWRRSSALRDAARELSLAGLDGEIEQALAKPGLDSGAVLVLAAARIQGPDVQPGKLVGPLLDVVETRAEGELDERSVSAATLLADANFRSLETEERRDTVRRLLKCAADSSRSPYVRLEASFAATRLGGGDDIRRARAVMEEFLASGDATLRSAGALALARSGAELGGELFEELRRLAVLPDENGRLAAAYLERERVRELQERKLKNLAEHFEEYKRAEGGESADPSKDPKNAGGKWHELTTLLDLVQRAHLEGDKVKRDDLLDAALQGILQSLDEHSTYMSPKSFARFEQELAANYGGIGAYVGEDRQDGLFTITRPIYSGPAYKAGLMSDDKIVRIDDWPTIGKPVDEIIKRLKGKPGTPVKLYLWRRGMDGTLIDRPSEEMVVSITRQAITIPAEQHQMLPGKIGLITLNEFSQVASGELRGPILNMLDGGMRGLILDLRNNSGGLLDEAVAVAELFLPKKTLVVSTESRVRPTERLRTERDPIVPAEMPMVVLVNRFTASAAEIVSGALQDHKRALVIGERSFGKGSVQNLITMPGMYDDQYEDENRNNRWDNWEKITKDGNGNGEFDFAPRVKLTIARYLLPSGRSIHREIDAEGEVRNIGGVVPDETVEATRIDAWRIEQMRKILDRKAPREYVDKHMAEHRERFSQIADNDRRDTALYPDFENFYATLRTPLPPDDVRQLLRAEIRRRIQDARGQEFPQGDFVEDRQLQSGIRHVLEKLGQSIDAVADYRSTIAPDLQPRLNLASKDKDELRDTLEQLNQALRADRKLPESTLSQLVDLLKESLEN